MIDSLIAFATSNETIGYGVLLLVGLGVGQYVIWDARRMARKIEPVRPVSAAPAL